MKIKIIHNGLEYTTNVKKEDFKHTDRETAKEKKKSLHTLYACFAIFIFTIVFIPITLSVAVLFIPFFYYVYLQFSKNFYYAIIVDAINHGNFELKEEPIDEEWNSLIIKKLKGKIDELNKVVG